MRVSALMTQKPFTLPPSASLDEAMQVMEEHHLRHLPLVEDGRLVGIVSDRDLLEVTGWLPARVREVYQRSSTDPRERTLRELSHTHVRTLSPDDTVVSAAVELVANRIGCLPVLEHGELVGILTETDLVRAFVAACRAGVLLGTIDPPVRSRMTRMPSTLSPDDTLTQALSLMRALNVRHLPVVRHDRVVGILSDRDLRRAAGCNRREEHPVDNVMSREVATVEPDEPLSTAASMMLARRIGAVPVVEDTRLIGILTLTDMLDHCLEVLREPDVRKLTPFAAPSRGANPGGSPGTPG